jgi:hypothetical protein
MTVGCVNLDKPKKVAECAAARNCSDDPYQQPQTPDANEQTKDAGPDASSEDKPKDLQGPDGPLADAPSDLGEDARDVGGADGKDTGSPDADSGTPPDVSPDLGPDLGGPDLTPDRTPDLTADLAPDQAPDQVPDRTPDLTPDRTPDLTADLAPDRTPDLTPDLTPDANPLSLGLQVYYKCESATGTTLPDSSGKGNNGTLSTAGVSFPTGKVGKALLLAKASQGSVTLPAAMFANVTDFTFAAWVNVTSSANWARVLDVGINAKLTNNTSTGTKYLNLVPKDEGTNLLFSITTDGYGSEMKLTGATPATATWKHVAVVLGASGGLYVDGTLVVNASAVTLRPRELGAIDYAFLGKSQFGADPYFDGMLDEVRVYGRALDAAEVKALHQFTGP